MGRSERLKERGAVSLRFEVRQSFSMDAFISDEQLGNILVCFIDGEWYQFIATERVGQP